MQTCTNNTLTNNIFVACGIVVSASTNNTINTSNKVNGKSVQYFEENNTVNINGWSDVGQLILVNCNNSVIQNLAINNTSEAIILLSQIMILSRIAICLRIV